MGPLTLHALPSLLTDCVIIGHAKKADVVFTPPQWFAMCAHMMNENPDNFFLMPYFDEKQGQARFAKAYKASAIEREMWTWDAIIGKAKLPASIGFYATNNRKQSRWGAMDFDSHDENKDRARTLAHKAFALLIREPNLYLALCTSVGDPVHSGWHLFIFTKDFHPCEEWTRLLKQVAAQIGTPIQSGVCEIFPNGSKGIGYGIRAPGTWNPKNGEYGLICHETVTKLLPTQLTACSSSKEIECSLYASGTTKGKNASSTSRENFRITAPRTRHAKLVQLVGVMFLQYGREVARQQAALQYTEADPAPVASFPEHLVEFDWAWAGMQRQWLAKLTRAERIKFDALTTDNEREAFKILRNWSQTDTPDFKVHCETLGRRLGMDSGYRGAGKLRTRFCSLGIMRPTADYVRRKLAARYEWIANREARQ